MVTLITAKAGGVWTTWGKALESTSSIVKALGRDLCRAEAKQVLEHVQHMQASMQMVRDIRFKKGTNLATDERIPPSSSGLGMTFKFF